MDYRNLGRSGMKVSPLCVGTMTWGDSTDQQQAIQIVDEALDAGINFFDTANCYHNGISEELLGNALARDGKREQAVVATKFTGPMGKGPNQSGSARYHMLRQCDESLRRLKTDRIDLYQVHLMDPDTALDEILLGLDTLVRQGKVICIGTSKWASALVAEGVALSKQHGWARFVSEQPPYNLLDRGVEKELVYTCLRYGIGLIPWGPLATGMLSGKYRPGGERPAGSRFTNAREDSPRFNQAALQRVEALRPIAERRGITLAQMSLAWLMQQPAVVSPILGVRTIEHLRSGLQSLQIRLTQDELDRIDKVAPPGSAVADYWDQVMFQRVRQQNLKHRIVGDSC